MPRRKKSSTYKVLVALLAIIYAMVYCALVSLVATSASFQHRRSTVVDHAGSNVVVVVPGHGTPRRLPFLKQSLLSLRQSFVGTQNHFECWVFVYKMSHMPKTVAALQFCTVIYNPGLWTDHMRRASRMIDATATHVILMMDDIDASKVQVPALIHTMDRVGYEAASPSLPGWQTSSLLQRKYCLAHRSDHIDILFTVFRKSAWDCWQSMIHDGISNRHGWGFDLTFSEYCGNIPLGIIDHEIAFHDPDECQNGGDCAARSYDSDVARKEMDKWIMRAKADVETIEEADAYFKHVAFLRPTTFEYCDLIQLNLPSERFYKTTTHRGGWKTIMQGAIDMGIVSTATQQQRYNQSQYVDLVDCIEEWFLWERRGPIQRDWIGITHMLTRDLLPDHQADDPFLVLDTYLDSPEFATSAATCAALVFFTTEVEQSASRKLQSNGFTNIKTCVIQHPIAAVEEDVIEFDVTLDLPVIVSNHSAIILLGQQYRRVATLHRINTRRKKIWLPSRTDEEFLSRRTQKELSIEKVTADPSVVIERVESNEEYDRLVKQNIVVIDFWAAAANNAVMEAIALKAPFFIRRLPGPEEYLGTDYPLFFSSVEELEEQISHPEALKEALTRGHAYLQSLDQENLSIAHFAKSLNACALSGLNNEKVHPGTLPPGVSPADTAAVLNKK